MHKLTPGGAPPPQVAMNFRVSVQYDFAALCHTEQSDCAMLTGIWACTSTSRQ